MYDLEAQDSTTSVTQKLFALGTCGCVKCISDWGLCVENLNEEEHTCFSSVKAMAVHMGFTMAPAAVHQGGMLYILMYRF